MKDPSGPAGRYRSGSTVGALVRPFALILLSAVAAGPPGDSPSCTLEDIYGDTGNSFQAGIGMLAVEGQPDNEASRSYGLGIDDMVVEWFEYTLEPDTTDCADGSCAVIELPSAFVYEGVDALRVTLLETTPYTQACLGGDRDGQVCYLANGDGDCTGGGICVPAQNDCNLDGLFNGPEDSGDCDGDGTPDLVVQADSEVEFGERLVLNRVGPEGSGEYRGSLAISTLVDSEGVLFLSQVGNEPPTVTVTYLDHDDGTGRLCQNSVNPEAQGRVQASAAVTLATCDVQVVSTSFTDNGDGDWYIDSSETVTLEFAVQNNCGFGLTNCVARLASNSPEVECIPRSMVLLGDLAGSAGGTPPVIPAPSSFEFRMDDTLADRTSRGLTSGSAFNAEFNISISCSEIDGLRFPQPFSLPMDLNLNDNGATTGRWVETFEGGSGGREPPSIALEGTKFYAQNIDAGIPGGSPAEGLVNGDGWRCQYSDPDWINSNSYNDVAETCFPNLTLAQSNRVYWQVDGQGTEAPDGGRAWAGSKSMHYGRYEAHPPLYNDVSSTPVGSVETAATREVINLGTESPELSFWHQVSLVDDRLLGIPEQDRSADRAVVQIKLIDEGGSTPLSDWMNLQPSQNAYAAQGWDLFRLCMYDPTDDGTTEDDFFDPTDPERRLGPSSTCHPEFSWSWQGSTSGDFDVSDVGRATTPPTSGDLPDLGQGTWVKTTVDLAQFRGRRVHLRFLVAGIQGYGETYTEWFHIPHFEHDDGWWIDEVVVDDVFVDGFATFDNDDFALGTCSESGRTCIAQCEFSLAPCASDPDCPGGPFGDETCTLPCPGDESCTQPPPPCGPVCSEVTANAFVTPDEVLNPSTLSTPAPGQMLTINGAAAYDLQTGALPSMADACHSGVLQFQFCRDGDALGTGPAPGDGDCDDVEDLVLRSWTENGQISVAPHRSSTYTMEARCSTKHDCRAAHEIDVDVTCPGAVNALGLSNVWAADETTLAWGGGPLDVDVWTSVVFGTTSELQNYPGSTRFETGKTSTALVPDPPVGKAVGLLVKADGLLNTIPLGYFCNSRTWRSGGPAEIAPGRDAAIGDPTP